MTSCADIAVIGAGVLGLSVGAELRALGHQVVVIAPDEISASAVAAGMIAPAMESVLDPWNADPVGRARTLVAGRDLWPAFAARHGLDLIRDGVDWIGPEAERILAELQGLGFKAHRTPTGLFCPEDWRIEPLAALQGLRRGLDLVRGRVRSIHPDGAGWRLDLADGDARAARRVVLACGTGLPDLPAPLRQQLTGLSAIGGRIAHTPHRLVPRPARFQGGYAVPTRLGTLIGATMEPGGLMADASRPTTALLDAARRAMDLSDLGPLQWRMGVRGAMPGGLPLMGASVLPNLFLALAPRRNGWLLAPSVAEAVVAAITQPN